MESLEITQQVEHHINSLYYDLNYIRLLFTQKLNLV
jgi:hypothetical protein